MAQIKEIVSIIKALGETKQSHYVVSGNVAVNSIQAVKEPVIPFDGSNAYTNNNTNNNEIFIVQQHNNTVKAPLPVKQTETKDTVVKHSCNNTDEYATKVNYVLKALVKDKDYMQIKGIKDPIITRSGLIKILRGMNYRYNSKLVDKQIADGIIAYTIDITVVDSEGCYICSALGSSNSGEKKFGDKGLSSDNILTAIASTRALRSCVKDILVR